MTITELIRTYEKSNQMLTSQLTKKIQKQVKMNPKPACRIKRNY